MHGRQLPFSTAEELVMKQSRFSNVIDIVRITFTDAHTAASENPTYVKG